jgi:serine/threonine protein kinase
MDESLLPGTILQSRYRISHHLGRGGMGAVYEAVDLRLNATVALKQALTADAELWKQFEREARLQARLNHPVLPRVSDYFTEGNRAFFVMQFVEGVDLAEIIAQQPGPLPRHVVIAWADQLLDALIYLHSRDRQIIHRDIKPHNLKVTPTGRIALLDFGLAKTQASDAVGGATSTSIFGYTPRYAPLEQIQDLGTSPQSDIYALGATLYHLLTGVKPPDALARAAALVGNKPNPLRPANEINDCIGVELAGILTRAMAQNPDERYRTATEFREALRRLGRIENPLEVEFSTHDSPIEATVGKIGETTLVRLTRAPNKLGSRAITALFVILLVAFGVFCRYYPWRLPIVEREEISKPQPAAMNQSVIKGARTEMSASRKRRS